MNGCINPDALLGGAEGVRDDKGVWHGSWHMYSSCVVISSQDVADSVVELSSLPGGLRC